MHNLITPDRLTEDQDNTIRPKLLKYFTGQKDICRNLEIFISAAKSRGEALDHILLAGPPGLGKTTMAQLIAQEMGSQAKITSGPILTKTGDIAAILTNIGKHDILFIDEIHRMNRAVEEMIYPAMEDFKIDILIGEGQAAKSLRLDIPHITVIGATTRLGLMSQPLRERFGIQFRFNFYTIEELAIIISRNAKMLGFGIEYDASIAISKRSRGTPRVAYRLLRRVRDFAYMHEANTISKEIADEALDNLGINSLGLDSEDKKYIEIIRDLFNGGPVGIETIAAAMCESSNTIEEIIEPYLIQMGIIQKTPRGRVLANMMHET